MALLKTRQADVKTIMWVHSYSEFYLKVFCIYWCYSIRKFLNICNGRVPLEKSRTLPLLPWKDFVPLRSKWVMIFPYYVRPLPASLSKITPKKINRILRNTICINGFRGDIGRASDF